MSNDINEEIEMIVKWFTLILIFSMGCSQPKYVQDRTGAADYQAIQQTKGDCTIKWKNGLCMIWYWQQKPTTKQAGILIFKTFLLNQVDETPVQTDLALVPQINLWMPEMGHGSSLTHTERLDVGTYRTTDVYFVMPGKWEIRFEMKDAEKTIEDLIVEISI